MKMKWLKKENPHFYLWAVSFWLLAVVFWFNLQGA